MEIVEPAPANIPYSSPLLIVPKKNPKTGECDHTNVQCVIDSRLVNKSLDRSYTYICNSSIYFMGNKTSMGNKNSIKFNYFIFKHS
jgi:hypothetical protein